MGDNILYPMPAVGTSDKPMSSSMRLLCSVAGVAAVVANTLMAQQRGAPPPAPPQPDPFRFQMMGPAEGGRIASITGVPGDLRVWYLGAASGGIWKSVDSGA